MTTTRERKRIKQDHTMGYLNDLVEEFPGDVVLSGDEAEMLISGMKAITFALDNEVNDPHVWEYGKVTGNFKVAIDLLTKKMEGR